MFNNLPKQNIQPKYSNADLPYFDLLLDLIENGDPIFKKAFSKHVHWGYWNNPSSALNTVDDYIQAAEMMVEKVISNAYVKKSQSILDVGCGFGGTIEILNKNYKNLNLFGLNTDSRQLEKAKLNVIAKNDNFVDFIEGTANSLPFSDQSLDTVLAIESIFHFPSRLIFFQEAYRVLKHGGRLVFSDFVPIRFILPEIWFNSKLFSGFFGTFDFGFTSEKYLDTLHSVGFNCLSNIEITRNTLPTYSFLRNLYHLLPTHYVLESLPGAVLLEYASRLGLIEYRVFTFYK